MAGCSSLQRKWGRGKMKFDKFLEEQLDSDEELRKEYDALQPIYEISDF